MLTDIPSESGYITKFAIMIFNIFKWFRQLRWYVIADPNDNSITFSKGLYKALKLLSYEVKPCAFVFTLSDTKEYAFCINPDLPEGLPMGEIQFNPKYKTIGFESLVPTVQSVFFDYGLPADRACKLSVSKGTQIVEGKELIYYKIERPYVQHPR